MKKQDHMLHLRIWLIITVLLWPTSVFGQCIPRATVVRPLLSPFLLTIAIQAVGADVAPGLHSPYLGCGSMSYISAAPSTAATSPLMNVGPSPPSSSVLLDFVTPWKITL